MRIILCRHSLEDRQLCSGSVIQQSMRPCRKVVFVAVLVALTVSMCLFWRTFGLVAEKYLDKNPVRPCSASFASDAANYDAFSSVPNPDYQESMDEKQFFDELVQDFSNILVPDEMDHVHRVPKSWSSVPRSSFVVVPSYWLEIASVIHKLLPLIPRSVPFKSIPSMNSCTEAPALEREYLRWLLEKMHRASSHLVLCFDEE